METVAITKDILQTLGVIDSAADYDDERYNVFISIALDRLKALLCDDSLTLDALPLPLVSLLTDLFSFISEHKPADADIQSETVENYSYTKRATASDANYLVRLRESYGDIINRYSKCEAKDGEISTATHNPLYTPDYYKERDPWL